MPETKSIQGTVTNLVSATSEKGKPFYKLNMKGYDMTLFCWETGMVEEQGVIVGSDVLVEYLPGDFPKIVSMERLGGKVQSTVNGKQQHTDTSSLEKAFHPGEAEKLNRSWPHKAVADFDRSDQDARIARSVAIKAAVDFYTAAAPPELARYSSVFDLAQDIETYILTGKKPEAPVEGKDKHEGV